MHVQPDSESDNGTLHYKTVPKMDSGCDTKIPVHRTIWKRLKVSRSTGGATIHKMFKDTAGITGKCCASNVFHKDEKLAVSDISTETHVIIPVQNVKDFV